MTPVDWEPSESPSTTPTDESLRWVEEQTGRSVTEVEPLVGGLSSAVHRLTLADHRTVVLRRYTLVDWIEREPYIPHDEARTLAALAELALGVATPMLIAADPDGEICDVPAVLMTEVKGRPDISPARPFDWAERLAACLARIHTQPAVEGLGCYRRWDDPARPVPTWTAIPEVWLEAKAMVAGELPAHPTVFLHRDFHPNNIHWLDGELCAVVDWLGACNGPIAADLAHCRWNIAVLTEPRVAEHFTRHYRALTGHSEELREFDLATILSLPVGPFPRFAWNALGRADLTSEIVAQKIDAWMLELLGR